MTMERLGGTLALLTAHDLPQATARRGKPPSAEIRCHGLQPPKEFRFRRILLTARPQPADASFALHNSGQKPELPPRPMLGSIGE
jgi:hypothetical protein